MCQILGLNVSVANKKHVGKPKAFSGLVADLSAAGPQIPCINLTSLLKHSGLTGVLGWVRYQLAANLASSSRFMKQKERGGKDNGSNPNFVCWSVYLIQQRPHFFGSEQIMKLLNEVIFFDPISSYSRFVKTQIL